MNWARSGTVLSALTFYSKAYHSQDMPNITQQSMHRLVRRAKVGGDATSQFKRRNAQCSQGYCVKTKTALWKMCDRQPRVQEDRLEQQPYRGYSALSTHWPANYHQHLQKHWFHDSCMKAICSFLPLPRRVDVFGSTCVRACHSVNTAAREDLNKCW